MNFNELTDDAIYQICLKMHDKEIRRMSQLSTRMNNICGYILQNRYNDPEYQKNYKIRKLNFTGNGLKSLEELDLYKYPSLEVLQIDHNELVNMIGCPYWVKIISCNGNNIDSFKGFPTDLIKLSIHENKLKSLQGCPPNVLDLLCNFNQLENLVGCPN